MSRRGSLRASDADREAIIQRLHRAAADGRIGADEFEQRVGAALGSRTYADLDATVADLPESPQSRRRSSHPALPAARWLARGVRANPILLLVLFPVLAATFALLLAVTVLAAVLVGVALVLGHRGGTPWIGSRRPRSSWS